MHKDQALSHLLALFAMVVLLISSEVLIAEPSRTVVLEAGIGIRGSIEIGRRAHKRGGELDDLQRRFGLQIQEDDSGVVTAISCIRPGCITSRGVGVQSNVKQVYQRYGRPIKAQSNSSRRIMEYSGVAFEIGGSDNQTVSRVVIFAKY